MLDPLLLSQPAAGHDYLAFRRAYPRPQPRGAQQEIRQELLQARELLLHVEQVATSGTLDARVAHDLMNFISIIRSYASLVHGAFSEGRVLDAGDLAALRTASRRAWELSEDVVWLDAHQKQMTTFDVGASLGALAPLLRAAVPARIALHVDLDPGPLAIKGFPVQLDRVLINLVLLARDAIEGAGAIHVAVQPGTFRNGLPSIHVVIKDTGAGLPEEVLDQRGTPHVAAATFGPSLALTAVRSVLSRMGGYLRVDSRRGQGTLCTLLLPAAAQVLEEVSA